MDPGDLFLMAVLAGPGSLGVAPDERVADRVAALVAQLAAPRRAERLAAQRELLALPPAAASALESAVAPPGFEPTAALDYVRRHRPPPVRVCAIAAGTHRVGTSFPADQNPPRDVTLADFSIDATEVSCFEWWQWVESGGGEAPPGWRGGRYPFGGERLPASQMTPEQATRFAAWVGGRLPTSDEWEVAAHGGDPRPYPWGFDFESRLRPAAPGDWRSDGRPPESGRDPADRAPCGALDFCSSLSEWVALPDGKVAARGGNWRVTKDLLRLTRAANPRDNRARELIGLRVVDRSRGIDR
jgi:formylglycine-generating enzyme required for sulfatase activity